MTFRPAAVAVAFPAFPITVQAQLKSDDRPRPAGDTASPSARTVSGSPAIEADYRFRGMSQSDRGMTVQDGFTFAHETNFYVGTWAPNLAGWGTFGGANMEFDPIGGDKAILADNATLDAGLTWSMYPGGAGPTGFDEPRAKPTGPVTPIAGAAHAPAWQAIGKCDDTGTDATTGLSDNPGARDDNLYRRGDGVPALAGTPITAKAHVGHSRAQNGLGPNATAVAPIGADLSNRVANGLRPSFGKRPDGTGTSLAVPSATC